MSAKTQTEISAILPASDIYHKCSSREVNEGEFVPEKHFYPRVVNAEVHSLIETFLSMENDRIIARYTNLNPRIKPETLKSVLSYIPSHFQWAGTYKCSILHSVVQNIFKTFKVRIYLM